MLKVYQKIILTLLVSACINCTQSEKPLFTIIKPEESGITFNNTIEESPEKNVMLYEYFYNGGGVAAADFNNDGLTDLYFTGNDIPNKLYVNRGNFKFEDVSRQAKVEGRKGWKTGVTVVDINADGWLDFYLCYSGPEQKENLSNELYINQGCQPGGVPVFHEEAKAYGIDAPFTFSTQATFFDLDRDGDLDMFLSNHGHRYFSPFFNTRIVRNKRHLQFGNRLYLNEGNHFFEISDRAGIHGGGINFGLSACVSDFNLDGWVDLYVTNDFEEQDYLYLNNKDNSFTEVNKKATGHTSKFSMGSDAADFNNDLLPDLLVVDMLPETLDRQKLLKGPDEFDRYMLMVDSGFHHQNMRNTLQLHQGISEGIPQFSEVGQLAGIDKTDWSWSALMADLDNDGHKDIFITNGFLRDFTNLDFLKYTYQDAAEVARKSNSILPVFELIKKMPSTKLANFVFKNEKDYTFSDKRVDWGMSKQQLSFGAVYADLDNDGDLELITNNTNEPASIYKNNSNDLFDHRFLKVKLIGEGQNKFAVGAKVIIKQNGQYQMQELIPSRGFQSSVDYSLNFGFGKKDQEIEVAVQWPDGKRSLVKAVRNNSTIIIKQSDVTLQVHEEFVTDTLPTPYFQDITISSALKYIHKENTFIDFKHDPLVLQEYSKSGPILSKGDVNGDGLEDLFIGSPMGTPSRLFIQKENQIFIEKPIADFQLDRGAEDQESVLFDADTDGDLDLYVVSGGSEFETGSAMLQDRFYLNDGRGNFSRQLCIPEEFSNGKCVTVCDYDKDGDIDLFIGGHVNPRRFPSAAFGGILRNDYDKLSKELQFNVATEEVNKSLKDIGIVSNATWVDLNDDQWEDLIVVGDWMPIEIFLNNKGKLSRMENNGLEQTGGLWSGIVTGDFDSDGDIDFVVGNAGNNLPWKPTPENPLKLFSSDFDDNGKIDPVICTRINNKDYPIASRDELLEQIPSLKKKFIYYKDYSKASMEEIFSPEQLQKGIIKTIHTLNTSYIENLGKDKFRIRKMPNEVQFSKVQSFLKADYNQDGLEDILAVGNFYPYRVQYGISDASHGLILLGDGYGNFDPVRSLNSGFWAGGDVRSIIEVSSDQKVPIMIIGKNNGPVQVLKRSLRSTYPKHLTKK